MTVRVALLCAQRSEARRSATPQNNRLSRVFKALGSNAEKSSPLFCGAKCRYWPILLQKSKVAGRLIIREITKREAIADSYSLTRISEVAREFHVGR